MTQAIREQLRAFAALFAAEQHDVAAAIVRRALPGDDLPEAALDQFADELFRRYDAEEAAGADRSAAR